MFLPGNLFKPSLMFAGKAGTCPRVEQPQRGFTHAGSWPYPQTLDQTGKACRRQTLAYSEN